MAAPITGLSNFPTSKQVPDHAILDYYNKQTYLGNSYIGNSGTVTLADTSEHPVLYLMNPAGATVSLFSSSRKLFAGDVTNTVVFKLYVNPTGPSGGSSITPVNCRLASSNASIATCKKTISTSTNGTLISTIIIGIGYQVESDSMLILDPGQSLLITAAGSAATTCVAEFVWYEL
jgi:hypothetical protein